MSKIYYNTLENNATPLINILRNIITRQAHEYIFLKSMSVEHMNSNSEVFIFLYNDLIFDKAVNVSFWMNVH